MQYGDRYVYVYRLSVATYTSFLSNKKFTERSKRLPVSVLKFKTHIAQNYYLPVCHANLSKTRHRQTGMKHHHLYLTRICEALLFTTQIEQQPSNVRFTESTI